MSLLKSLVFFPNSTDLQFGKYKVTKEEPDKCSLQLIT